MMRRALYVYTIGDLSTYLYVAFLNVSLSRGCHGIFNFLSFILLLIALKMLMHFSILLLGRFSIANFECILFQRVESLQFRVESLE